MKKIYLLLSLLPVLLSSLASSETMSESQVRSATETFVKYVSADSRSDALIMKMEPYTSDGVIYAYVAHLSDSGFCICGSDDLVLPVYLYSPGGSYDPEIPVYDDILEAIERSTEYYRDGISDSDPSVTAFSTELNQRASDWRVLASGGVPLGMIKEETDRGNPTVLVLNYHNDWNQRSPYNNRCPVLTPGSDEHAAVGCVATSSTQIMHFWKWPGGASGTFSDYYGYRYTDDWIWQPLATQPYPNINNWSPSRLQWSPLYGGRLGINGYWDYTLYEHYRDADTSDAPGFKTALHTLYFSLTHDSLYHSVNLAEMPYNWDILKANHDDGISDQGDIMVAAICYHFGMAIGMDYGLLGSSSWTLFVPNTLAITFDYDFDAVHTNWGIGFNEALREEIRWNRPVAIDGVKHPVSYTHLRAHET